VVAHVSACPHIPGAGLGNGSGQRRAPGRKRSRSNPKSAARPGLLGVFEEMIMMSECECGSEGAECSWRYGERGGPGHDHPEAERDSHRKDRTSTSAVCPSSNKYSPEESLAGRRVLSTHLCKTTHDSPSRAVVGRHPFEIVIQETKRRRDSRSGGCEKMRSFPYSLVSNNLRVSRILATTP
jgi:hypothetical protein